MNFAKAKKEKLKSKIALEGPAGSGKTYSALLIATGMGGKTALIDTENRSSLLYADLEYADGKKFEFDMAPLFAPFAPERYIELIKEAEKAKYDNIIIDSATHEWDAEGGILDLSNELAKTTRSSFGAWAKLTPRHNRFVRAILDSSCNVITCFRTKTAYEVDQQEKDGKTVSVPKKIGLKPITREGFDFECTICFSLTAANIAEATKDRTALYRGIQKVLDVSDGKRIKEYLDAGVDRSERLFDWMKDKWKDAVSPPLQGKEVEGFLLAWANTLSPDRPVKKVPEIAKNIELLEAMAKVLNKNEASVTEFVEKHFEELNKGKK